MSKFPFLLVGVLEYTFTFLFKFGNRNIELFSVTVCKQVLCRDTLLEISLTSTNGFKNRDADGPFSSPICFYLQKRFAKNNYDQPYYNRKVDSENPSAHQSFPFYF